ncbi:unnamed protein product, partial [Urochloa humidicola]
PAVPSPPRCRARSLSLPHRRPLSPTSQPPLLFSFPAGLHHSSPRPPLSFSAAAAPAAPAGSRSSAGSGNTAWRRGARARPQAPTRRCGSKPCLPLRPTCAAAGPPAQRHLLARPRRRGARPGGTTRRGGEGGDGAADGAKFSAWPQAGAAAQAYPLGRGATKPVSARGGHWDATRRIQPTVAGSVARARLPAPWPLSTASPVPQQTQLRTSCQMPRQAPGGSSLGPFPPRSTFIGEIYLPAMIGCCFLNNDHGAGVLGEDSVWSLWPCCRVQTCGHS